MALLLVILSECHAIPPHIEQGQGDRNSRATARDRPYYTTSRTGHLSGIQMEGSLAVA